MSASDKQNLRRSQRSTKGKAPSKYGWDDIPDSVSQAGTASHGSGSSRRSRELIAKQRLVQVEVETAEELAELEVSVLRKELALMKELAQKRLEAGRAAAQLVLPSRGSSVLWDGESVAPSGREGQCAAGEDVLDALQSGLTKQVLDRHNWLLRRGTASVARSVSERRHRGREACVCHNMPPALEPLEPLRVSQLSGEPIQSVKAPQATSVRAAAAFSSVSVPESVSVHQPANLSQSIDHIVAGSAWVPPQPSLQPFVQLAQNSMPQVPAGNVPAMNVPAMNVPAAPTVSAQLGGTNVNAPVVSQMGSALVQWAVSQPSQGVQNPVTFPTGVREGGGVVPGTAQYTVAPKISYSATQKPLATVRQPNYGGIKSKPLQCDVPEFKPQYLQPVQASLATPTVQAPTSQQLTSMPLMAPASLHYVKPLELPRFDGKQANYVAWRQRFNRIVHEDVIVSDEYKFERLREAVAGGSAADLITGIVDGAGAYQAALHELGAWYGGSDREVERQHQELIALSRINSERDVTAMEKLSVKLRNFLINMRSYGVTPGRDLYLSVTRKLPRGMLLRYMDSHDNAASDVFLLSDWLLDRVRKCRQVDQRLASIPEHKPEDRKSGHQGRPERRMERTLMVEAPAKAPNKAKKCHCCDGPHKVEDCLRFKDLPCRKRWETIKVSGLCLCCFKPGHRASECKGRKCTAQGCGKPHHLLLHYKPSAGTGSVTKTESTNESTNHTMNGEAQCGPASPQVAFMTLPVIVKSGHKELVCTALLDPASTASYVSETVANSLGLEADPVEVSIAVVGGHTIKAQRQRVSVMVSNADKSVQQQLSGWVLPEVTSTCAVDWEPLRSKWPHLSNINLAYHSPTVDILIGLDAISMHTVLEERYGGPNQPIARRLPLGWVIMGPLDKKSTSQVQTFLTVDREDDLAKHVKWLCVQEEVGTESAVHTMTKAESEAEGKTAKSFTYVDGRFTVGIPWIHDDDKPHVSSNVIQAEQRLKSLEKTLRRKPQLRDQYQGVIQSHLDKGYIAQVPEADTTSDDQWYLLHFPVVRTDKETTKVRVVYDGSATFRGQCLNEEMHAGPKMIADLVAVLLRFCLYPVALVADVSEMFLQVGLQESDRKYHRFLWRPTPTSPTEVYEFCRVVFGIKASPYLASRTLKETTDRFGDQFEHNVKTAVENSFFVDDFLSSHPSTAQAQLIQQDSQKLLHKGSFHLRKWRSNVPEALDNVPAEDLAQGNVMSINPADSKNGQLTKTLGVAWDSAEDVFTFNYADSQPENLTRCVVLSKLSKVFDPRGQIAPFTIRARMLFQELWVLNHEWDSPLSSSEERKWRNWFAELPALSAIHAERCFTLANLDASVAELSLHTFTDASQRAIAAATFVRAQYPDDQVKVTLAFAKAKPSPVKHVTIPKLELRGAVLGIRVSGVVADALSIPPERWHFWTDSLNVLYWVRSGSHWFVLDVANRVAEIQTSSKGEQWRHVPGKLNPADKATRGLKALDLAADATWWSGPAFLVQPEADWPRTTIKVPGTLPSEKRRQVQTLTSSVEESVSLLDMSRYSNIEQPRAVIGWCYRFLNNCKLAVRATREREGTDGETTPNTSKFLTPDELQYGELFLIACAQKSSFGQTFDRLQLKKPLSSSDPLLKLNPVIQTRVGVPLLVMDGRLSKSPAVPDALRFPLILPSKHPVTSLIICREDELAGHHAGANHLLSLLREKYWIVHGLSAVKSHKSQCAACRRLHAQSAEQLMGPLPEFRTGGPNRPFAHAAVDYAGPILVKVGRKTSAKRWICLFTCLLTRGVHLEVAFGLDSTSFLMAFTRFAKRRGTPVLMVSDNGTNFSAADKELREAVTELLRSDVDASLAKKGTEMKWRFNPPRAPHHGGVFEILVRCTKRALQGTIGKSNLTDEELLTALSQAEWLLNS